MTTITLRCVRALELLAGLVLVLLIGVGGAAAQCTGASAVEDFAPNMKGCAATLEFSVRSAMCAPGWHVCSSAEWVARSNQKVPTYNYWTNDNLKYSSDSNGCVVSAVAGTDCGATPMRVCTIARGDFDGVYASPTTFYTVQTFTPEGDVTVVTSLNRTTLLPQTFAGPTTLTNFTPVFSGARLGGAGSLTLTFTSDTEGTDGTSAIALVASPQSFLLPTRDFYTVTDPLGNTCNWHSCGAETALPNRYFGGCSGNTTAGVLCCQ